MLDVIAAFAEKFQSTPPSREATVTANVILHGYNRFQSTPPSREATS